MLTREELEERRTFIGASDAAAVLGMSPYGGPLDIYMAKVLGPPPERDELEGIPIVIGNALEPFLLQRYTAVTGRRVVKGERKRHKKYPFIAATPDGIVEGAPRLVECKYAGTRAASWWSNETVPDQYFVQAQIQAEVWDRDFVDLAAAVDHDFHIYEIARDRELAEMWLEQLVRFWEDHVLKRDPPPARDHEEARRFLTRRYPVANENMLPATPDDVDLARQLVFARTKAKSANEEADALETALRARVGDAAGIEGICTFKNDKTGRVLWKAVAEELKPPPELVAKHTAAPGRRFTLKIKES